MLSGRSAPRARFSLATVASPFRAQGALLRFLLVALLAFTGVAHSQAIQPLPFKNHAEKVRFQHLTRQLRCLVCQNETIADSNAELARDLRLDVFQQMQQGRSDKQIKQYLVARYSDFVLYDPPLQADTLLLWFGPLLILLAGGAVVVMAIRKRSRDAGITAQAPAVQTPTDNEDDW